MNTQLHSQMDKIKDKYTPQYLCEGNYTICLLMKPSRLTEGAEDIASFGIAKCNPNCDELLAERGREIALARAVKKLTNKTASKKKKIDVKTINEIVYGKRNSHRRK